MKEKELIWTAKVVSIVFTPFYLPLTGLVALYIFSYLNVLPLAYKLVTLITTYIFTVLMPTLLIRLYRRYQGWSLLQLFSRERRVVPYIISILCYFTCYHFMHVYHMPHFMSSILVAALVMQIACAIINVWWKISTHTGAIGTVTGGLLAFSLIFNFNPTWWLCLVLLLAGMVGTSRMILRQHTLGQVCGGFGVGLLCGFTMILVV
ncbi:MAG: phosphatase PAP2 family protein [Prevotella sp.]|nr:phosphatase PAP2 family protein [Prevotella sp.]